MWWRKNELSAAFLLFSWLCVLVLLAVVVYGGTIFPSSEGMSRSEAVLLWMAWSAIVAAPLISAGLTLVDVLNRRKR